MKAKPKSLQFFNRARRILRKLNEYNKQEEKLQVRASGAVGETEDEAQQNAKLANSELRNIQRHKHALQTRYNELARDGFAPI